MKKEMSGECHDILRVLPFEQLRMFSEIRKDEKKWKALNQYAFDRKQIRLDQIYRLRRPKDINDVVKNMVDHEYYVARIAELVVMLQIMENADDEIERRERSK